MNQNTTRSVLRLAEKRCKWNLVHLNATIFPHSLARLEVGSFEAARVDMLFTRLVQTGTDVETEYMPSFIDLDVVRIRVKNRKGSNRIFHCELSRKPNEIFRTCLERRFPGFRIVIQSHGVTLCSPESQQTKLSVHECRDLIYDAGRDYNNERRILLFRVHLETHQRKQREYWESQVKTELVTFEARCREAAVPTELEVGVRSWIIWTRLPLEYRSILEAKFEWWKRVLDAPTIHHYRTAFALDPATGASN